MKIEEYFICKYMIIDMLTWLKEQVNAHGSIRTIAGIKMTANINNSFKKTRYDNNYSVCGKKLQIHLLLY